ncbi:MAG: alkaline phosphatase family protein [Blastococcus sp.]
MRKRGRGSRGRGLVAAAAFLVLVLAVGTVTWWFLNGDTSPASRAATGASSSLGSSPETGRASPSVPHVMIIVEENHSFGQVIGNRDMPFFNRLAQTYGLATNYAGVSHPSEPNYLAMVSGSTWGDPQDRTPQEGSYPGPTLVDQLAARGVAWRAYLEDMPRACDMTDTYGPGGYDVNHNPFLYFRSIRDTPAQCAHDVPFSQFARDLRDGSAAPFVFVAPNTTHDMHNGTPAQGDAWLSEQFAAIFASKWYRQGGVVVVTFDEGETTDRVATVVVSEADRGVAPLTTRANHYALLRAVEKLYGLPLLGSAADARNGDLTPLLRH